MTMPRHFLHLDALHLDVWQRQGTAVRHITRFAADENGVVLFRQYLANCKSQPFYLLADLVDEDFQQEALPYVRGRDRQALLSRKLAQIFPGTPFHSAVSLGRDKDGRRDENFLLSAITRPQALQPWLDAMVECDIALAGVYIPSQLTAVLPHAQEPGCRILVTLGKSGLRQSCYINGTLLFSRLVATAANSFAEAAATVCGEAEKIRHYLVSQRLTQRDEHIHLICLATPDDLAQLPAQLALPQYFSCRHLPVPPHALGCRQASDAILLQSLASQTPASQYLPVALRSPYRLHRARLTLMTASLSGVLVSLVAVGVLLFAANDYRANQAQAKQAEQAAQRHYQALLATLPETREKPADIRALVSASTQLMQQAPRIDEMLFDISTVLDTLPPVTLHRLNWRLADNAEGEGTAGRSKPPAFVVAELDVELPEPALQSRLIEGFAALPNTRAYLLARPAGVSNPSAPLFSVRLLRALKP